MSLIPADDARFVSFLAIVKTARFILADAAEVNDLRKISDKREEAGPVGVPGIALGYLFGGVLREMEGERQPVGFLFDLCQTLQQLQTLEPVIGARIACWDPIET